MEKEITCLNRIIGRCPNCERDYNLNHHPNNLDCENYKETIIRTFEVKQK